MDTPAKIFGEKYQRNVEYSTFCLPDLDQPWPSWQLHRQGHCCNIRGC
ncbi:hypothetical protein C4K39_2673 [Pseudomonas sessilinigenes]|nr:hypothetical protein C4K39_2673 [Pseudomonas sessilinigenes]